MSLKGRASAIPGPKETLLGWVEATEGSGDSTDGQGVARIGMTRQGGVRDGEAGPEVGEESAGTEGRHAESSRRKVGADDDDDVTRLAVNAGWDS